MVHFRFPIRQLPIALQDFATDMETIVDQVFHQTDCKAEKGENPETAGTFRPTIDIYESELQFDIYIDLPGVTPDAVKLEMQEDRLAVSGVRAEVARAEGVSSHRVERTSGPFSRSIRLPKQLDVDKIDAAFANGVLHVALPKKVKPAPRTIQIKTV